MTAVAFLTGFGDDAGGFNDDKSFVCELEDVLLNCVCTHANSLSNGSVTGIALVRFAIFAVEQVGVDGNLSGQSIILFFKEGHMKQSIYKTYDDLPLFLNAAMVAQVLGIISENAYARLHFQNLHRRWKPVPRRTCRILSRH